VDALMGGQEYHEQFPEEFEAAFLESMGAVMGWCYGKGETPPHLTDVLHEAYRLAAAAAFNAGIRAARAAVVR
jgi:hypothetical protein